MRWLFREQPFENYGIDAHIEAVETKRCSAGWSHSDQERPELLRLTADDSWWFRDKAAHFEYWLDFSIPVVVVLVDLDSGLCHWQLGSVGPRTIVWLNEAQRSLRDPSPDVRTGIATALLELLADDSLRGPG